MAITKCISYGPGMLAFPMAQGKATRYAGKAEVRAGEYEVKEDVSGVPAFHR